MSAELIVMRGMGLGFRVCGLGRGLALEPRAVELAAPLAVPAVSGVALLAHD
jgi:hypothetical protein